MSKLYGYDTETLGGIVGPRGPQGVQGPTGPAGDAGNGIANITFDDNNNGSVTITITMDDATEFGPFTGTLVSDNIISLNQLTLTGTDLADKFTVSDNATNTVFTVDTLAKTITSNGSFFIKYAASGTLYDALEIENTSADADSTVGIRFKGRGTSAEDLEGAISLLTAGFDFSKPIIVPSLESVGFSTVTINNAGTVTSALRLSNSNAAANSRVNLEMVSRNAAGSGNVTGNIYFGEAGFSFDRNLVATADFAGNPKTLLSLSNSNAAGDSTARIEFRSRNSAGSSLVTNYFGHTGTTFTMDNALTISKALSGNAVLVLTLENSFPSANSRPYIEFKARDASNNPSSGLIVYNAISGFIVDKPLVCASLRQSTNLSVELAGLSIRAGVNYNNSTFAGGGATRAAVLEVIDTHVRMWTNIAGNVPAIRYNFYHAGIEPTVHNACDLGSTIRGWKLIYSDSGIVTVSDERKKQNITTTTYGLDFVNALRPVKYQFVAGTSGRYHQGLIAQEVKAVMDAQSITTTDFAGFIKDESAHPETGEVADFIGLRYEEFMAPMIKAIQELSAKVDSLQSELDALAP